jgi:hypothetical protein
MKDANCVLVELNSVMTCSILGAKMEDASGLDVLVSSLQYRNGKEEAYVTNVTEDTIMTVTVFFFIDQF